MPQRESDSSRKCHDYSDTLLGARGSPTRSRLAPYALEFTRGSLRFASSPHVGAGSEINGVVCRFMTHPPNLCAWCMSQGEFVTGRTRGGQRATVRSSRLTALARPLPVWAASLLAVTMLVASHLIGVLVAATQRVAPTRRRMSGCKSKLGPAGIVANGRKPSIWNRRGPGSRLAHDAGTLGRDVN
jgi:hypothetical protein